MNGGILKCFLITLNTMTCRQPDGKAEDVLSILEDLGRVPDNLRTRILEEQDLDLLTTWVKGSARAASVEEFIMKYLPELKES